MATTIISVAITFTDTIVLFLFLQTKLSHFFGVHTNYLCYLGEK